MKCCMVASIHTLLGKSVGGGDGGRVDSFVFFTLYDNLESICKNFAYRDLRDDVIHREIFQVPEVKISENLL